MVWGGGFLGEDLGVLDFAGGKRETALLLLALPEMMLTGAVRGSQGHPSMSVLAQPPLL